MTTKIRQRQLGDTNVTNTAPTVNDDITLRYGVGSKWFDTATQTLYICEDATDTAAVWTGVSGSSFALTNGEGTTANGTAVDLGGTYIGNIVLTSGGGGATFYIDNRGTTGIHFGDTTNNNAGAELGIASTFLYWDDVAGNHVNRFGINTISPTEALHVVGSIRMVDGNEQAGYVLTSDANGVGSWQVAAGGGGTVSGTGTDNHVPRWDGTTDIQDSALIISDVSAGSFSLSSANIMGIFVTGDNGTLGHSIILNGATVAGAVDGGQFLAQGGTATGSGSAGLVKLTGGQNTGTGDGGTAQLQGGAATGASGDGGWAVITGGSSTTSGNGGDVLLKAGAKGGAGTDGHVRIEDTNNGFSAIFDTSLLLLSSKTYSFPNATGNFMVQVGVPATATSPGVVGTYAFETGWLYVCVATNTWERTVLATF